MSNKQNVKKLKKVEEMRKEGTLAAQVDAQTGQEINPHVPTFILDSPWYLNNNQSSLVHQRKDSASNSNLNQWYNRGATTSTATKYRKGACTNCGALTHKQKDCLDRPRKVAAKYSNLDIKPDEVIQSFDLSFEAKRDRWNGYDPNTQAEAIKEWEEIDEMKRLKLLKDSKLAQVDDLMEEKYAEDVVNLNNLGHARNKNGCKSQSHSSESPYSRRYRKIPFKSRRQFILLRSEI